MDSAGDEEWCGMVVVGNGRIGTEFQQQPHERDIGGCGCEKERGRALPAELARTAFAVG